MFVINDIISITEVSGENELERILWIDEGNVICYTINIEKEKALPVRRKISDLQELHKEGLLQFVQTDPFAFVYKDDEQIPDKHKVIRDERWTLIKDLVFQEPEIYQKEKRGPLIQTTMEATGKTKRFAL